MDGKTYMQFIAPGLVYGDHQRQLLQCLPLLSSVPGFQKSIEEMLISPMPRWQIIVGYMSGGLFRGLVVERLYQRQSLSILPNIPVMYYLASIPLLFFFFGHFFNGWFFKRYSCQKV